MTPPPDAASPEGPFAASARPRRSPDAEGEGTGDDYFVLDVGSGKYYALGEVGGFVWDRLDGSLTLADIARAVTERFEVTVATAEADVIEFAGMLRDLGLLDAE